MLPAQLTDTDSDWSYNDPARATRTSTPAGSSDKRQDTTVATEAAMYNDVMERIANIGEKDTPPHGNDKYIEEFPSAYDSVCGMDLGKYWKAMTKNSNTKDACENGKNTVSQWASSDNDDGASAKVAYPSPHLLVTDKSESVVSGPSTGANVRPKSRLESFDKHDVLNVSERMSFQEFQRRRALPRYGEGFEFELDEYGQLICQHNRDSARCRERLVRIFDGPPDNHIRPYLDLGPGNIQKEPWYCKKCDFIWLFSCRDSSPVSTSDRRQTSVIGAVTSSRTVSDGSVPQDGWNDEELEPQIGASTTDGNPPDAAKSPEPKRLASSAYTVTYWATVKSEDKTFHILIDSDNVTGTEKAIIEGNTMKKAWKWMQDTGLGDKVGLQDAFDLAQDLHEVDEPVQVAGDEESGAPVKAKSKCGSEFPDYSLLYKLSGPSLSYYLRRTY